MPASDVTGDTLSYLDAGTRALAQLGAVLAAGTEAEVRASLQAGARATSPDWIEEVVLQTYLFAGFPRALNAMREWRRIGPPAPAAAIASAQPLDDRSLGERTCARVYGSMYEKLRSNVRALHPALDDWMIVEGYGKVLSRPGLDLPRRELCIVAACAATGQDRQLQSHLHGARNVGVAERVVTETIECLREVVPESLVARAMRLWDRIRDDVH